jgi:hypothetical protein
VQGTQDAARATRARPGPARRGGMGGCLSGAGRKGGRVWGTGRAEAVGACGGVSGASECKAHAASGAAQLKLGEWGVRTCVKLRVHPSRRWLVRREVGPTRGTALGLCPEGGSWRAQGGTQGKGAGTGSVPLLWAALRVRGWRKPGPYSRRALSCLI